MKPKIKVLFVCLGNICRSPTAHAIFQQLLEQHDLTHLIECDSAGTNGYHDGELPDPRSIAHGKIRGYKLDHISRKVQTLDFENFDMIFGMDANNVQHLRRLAVQENHKNKIRLITEFTSIAHEKFRIIGVPDPYQEGPEGFDLVLDLLESCCENLLAELRKEIKI